MGNRTLIGDLKNKIGQDVRVGGWVSQLRDLKNMQFVVLRDHTGDIQGTNFKSGTSIDEVVSSLSRDTALYATGTVIDNPQNKQHGYELKLSSVDIQSKPEDKIPISSESGIEHRMDWRYIDLRDEKKRLIFEVQTTMEHAMRDYWVKNGFMEIHSPKLVEGASESGAELFTLDYFGQKASLAQSPQFYKQMAMAAGFDKVFEIGPVFRANQSFTARHDTEFTMIDMELAWVDSHEDVMQEEEQLLTYMLSEVASKHGADIETKLGAKVNVPALPFPRVTVADAYKIIEQNGHTIDREHKGDLDPEGERVLANYIANKFGHEFVFVTDYPISARPFYHMRHADRPAVTKSFDLIWKGLEITTGAQREHRYGTLIDQMHEKDVNPNSISSYRDFFKYGCPPHGGCGIGMSRLLMNITGMPNVREVTLVYRGPKRLTP